MNVLPASLQLSTPYSRSALRPLTAATVLWLASQSSLALEINQASEAELDGLKGIGPALSGKILQARENGPFQDWADLMRRVKGIRPKSAEQFSGAGLTVNGASYSPARSARPARSAP